MEKKPELVLKPFQLGPRKPQLTKRERARTPPLSSWTLLLDEPLALWIIDRSVILGVSAAQLARDILGLYANLVNEAESEMKIDYGIGPPQTVTMKERNQGYLKKLVPQGIRPTHLDDSPIGIEEMA